MHCALSVSASSLTSQPTVLVVNPLIDTQIFEHMCNCAVGVDGEWVGREGQPNDSRTLVSLTLRLKARILSCLKQALKH